MSHNEEHDDLSRSVPLKITLTELLSKNLTDYAKANSKSKTEVIKDALQRLLSTDQTWNSRAYFFKKAKQTEANELLKRLKQAPKGTLIKVASSKQDTPDSAYMLIGNLVKVDGSNVLLEFANSYRPTSLTNNILNDPNAISLCTGTLVVPISEIIESGWSIPQNRYLYEINIDLIWDIDDQPQTFFKS